MMTAAPDTPSDQTLALRFHAGRWRLAFLAFVRDKPGELADVCAFMAEREANIERFAFNRSENPRLVDMEISLPSPEAAGPAARDLLAAGRLFDPSRTDPNGDHAGVTEPEGLLRLKVNLVDAPGSMASLAECFRRHTANVIHMAYHAQEAPGLVSVTLAAPTPEAAAALLDEMNQRGDAYHVEWTGPQGGDMGRILGLNEVESFIVQLKALLPDDQRASVEELIRSSGELRRTLAEFRREAGETSEALAASEVFANILKLAAASVTKTGPRFALSRTGPLRITEQLTLSRLACPTGANAYLISDGETHALIDSSYGLYYPDAMAWLRAQGVDPDRIELILLTHADADHAGWAAHLQRDAGARVMRHPQAGEVFRAENRAQGAQTSLHALNAAYTRLINRFSDLQIPQHMEDFPTHPQGGELGGFPVCGLVRFRDLELTVLESLGGHVPGNVFFLDRSRGMLFSGDYLIDLASLSDRDKETLSLARFLLTSTNADSRVFGREMAMLQSLMRETAARLPSEQTPRIFPGHGGFYALAEARW
jgi:glyoxylase-like metal-dependent hydrolase (beta-lactamase superfamily II)/ACT domain-containing protein